MAFNLPSERMLAAMADDAKAPSPPDLSKARRFVVKGSYGPLREGELERAQQWGTELAAALTA